MTELEQMKSYCQYWDGLYNFENTKDVVGTTYPFRLIQEHGILFNSENSSELKSDETLLLNKAIKRIGQFNDVDYMNRFSTPVKVAFHENNSKLRLFHGLFYKENSDSNTELTWLVINGRVIDMDNKITGAIPKGYIYFGVEIPKQVLNTTILSKGFLVNEEYLEYKPYATTILMKSLHELLKFYGQKKEEYVA